MTEVKALENKVYIISGILLVALIAASGYLMLQTSVANKRMDALEASQKNVENDAAAIKSSVAAINSQLNVKNVYFFYDSECGSCRNDELLKYLPQTASALAKKNVRLQAIDLQGNYTLVQDLGIARVPAFYASSDDMASNSEINAFFTQLAQGNFIAFHAIAGTYFVSPVSSMLLGKACANQSAVQASYFFSESCAYCKRIYDLNGTLINPPSQKNYASVAEEALNETKQLYQDKMQVSSFCLGIHSAAQNLEIIGVNKSDEELCRAEYGNFESGSELALNYGVNSAPSLVFDCKYVVNARTSDELNFYVCMVRPDLCISKPPASGITMHAANATNETNSTG